MKYILFIKDIKIEAKKNLQILKGRFLENDFYMYFPIKLMDILQKKVKENIILSFLLTISFTDYKFRCKCRNMLM